MLSSWRKRNRWKGTTRTTRTSWRTTRTRRELQDVDEDEAEEELQTDEELGGGEFSTKRSWR